MLVRSTILPVNSFFNFIMDLSLIENTFVSKIEKKIRKVIKKQGMENETRNKRSLIHW